MPIDFSQSCHSWRSVGFCSMRRSFPSRPPSPFRKAIPIGLSTWVNAHPRSGTRATCCQVLPPRRERLCSRILPRSSCPTPGSARSDLLGYLAHSNRELRQPRALGHFHHLNHFAVGDALVRLHDHHRLWIFLFGHIEGSLQFIFVHYCAGE